MQALPVSYFDQLLDHHFQNPNSPRNAIRDMRPLFESIFKTLTAGEKRAFSSMYARTLYVMRTRKTPPELNHRIHGFRRFANQIVHNAPFPIEEGQYAACLEAMSRIIAHFSQSEIPASLPAIYEGRVTPFPAPPKVKREMLPSLRCVVLEKGDIQSSPDQSSRQFQLLCSGEDPGMEEFRLILRDNAVSDLTLNHRLLWQYATLQIHHISRLAHQPDVWASTNATRVVLEPDYLLDASDLAECFQPTGANPFLFFLAKLTGSDAGIAAFRGQLVNDLLDRLLREDTDNPQTALLESIKGQPLKAAKFGQAAIDQVCATIREHHYPQLRDFIHTLRNRKVRIEPTFVAPAFGLQGRLDLLVEGSGQRDATDIIELKSGKAPNGAHTWINHQIQVLCYQLLLQSAFPEKETGTRAILYSAATQNPLRDVTPSPNFEAEVLLTRNRIIKGLYDMASGHHWVVDRLGPEQSSGVPAFRHQSLEDYHTARTTADPPGKAWYDACLAFLIRELITARVGGPEGDERIGNGFAGLWLDSSADKERRFCILDGLTLRTHDEKEGVLHLSLPSDLYHNFREGDIGIIYKGGQLFPDPLHQQILKGLILGLDNGQLVFALRNRQVDPGLFKPGTTWIVEHDFQESGFWTQVADLFRFLRAPSATRASILGLRPPGRKEMPYRPDPEMNEIQNRLLHQALEATDYFLLQGPPGTGKTSTLLTAIVRRTLEDPEARIVCLAFTRRAVREIADKLRKAGITFLLTGNSSGESDAGIPHLATEGDLDTLRTAIAGFRVWLGTVSGFALIQDDLAAMAPLHTLVVDEASQLTEPALGGLLTRFRKFVLIGDQNQLPAVVTQPENRCHVQNEHLLEAGFHTLSESLFGRLYRQASLNGWHHAFGMLRTHYRMHEKIADLVNPYYSNLLESGTEGQKASFPVHPLRHEAISGENILKSGRLIFIPTLVPSPNRTSVEEAERVVALIEALHRTYAGQWSPRIVGVVTPWRAQIAQIRSRMPPHLRQDVLVDTVERFQGLEKKHIIVSLAVGAPRDLRALQSLDPEGKVDRKLVVTLSRAEEQIILLGHESVLRQSNFYRAALDKMVRVDWATK